MKGYVQNIEDIAVKNKEFRRVLYTAMGDVFVDDLSAQCDMVRPYLDWLDGCKSVPTYNYSLSIISTEACDETFYKNSNTGRIIHGTLRWAGAGRHSMGLVICKLVYSSLLILIKINLF